MADLTDVPNAELAVLQALWLHGPLTIRRLVELLYPGGKSAQYGTVQKLLERLEQRGHVRRDRNPWPHVFEAAADRETFLGLRLREVAERLCGGSMTPLLMHLLKVESFGDEERQELRAFLARLQQEKSDPPPESAS